MAGLFWLIAVLGVLGTLASWTGPYAHAQDKQSNHLPSGQNADTERKITREGEGQRSGWRNYKEKIERNEKFVTATSTIFIAAFTVLLAFATFFLWSSTTDLVDDAKHNAERQLRAYVGVNNMSLAVYPLEGAEFAFLARIEMKNFGQTPAREMSVWAEAAIDKPDAKPFDMSKEPERPDGGAIAFPTAGFNIDKGWAIFAADKEALLKREKFVFMWGTVRYTDAFGKDRYFKYRMQSTGQILLGTTGAYAVAPLKYESN